MNRYEVQRVGGERHTDWWIPAEELDELNDNIVGVTEVIGEYRAEGEQPSRRNRWGRSGGSVVADLSNLKRPRQPMPEFVRLALETSRLMETYRARPAYQQNEYLGWIERAKRQETKDKRLRQMLDELERGGVYMNMKHPGSAKNRS